MTALVAVAAWLAVGGGAGARQTMVEDFEALEGWKTNGHEISVSLDRAHARTGRNCLHIRMVVDHKNGDTRYPMGWPSATKVYSQPIDLSGYDFLEMDVYFRGSSGRDPDFAMHVTMRDDQGRELYRTTLIDLRQGRWAHERFCIAGLSNRRLGELHLWFSEDCYDDGEVVDVYVDSLRATRAERRAELPSFGLGPTRGVLARGAGAVVWLAEPTEKLLRTADVPEGRVEAVRISAARGEYASVQVVLRPEDGGLGSVSAQPGDLVGPDGTKIGAEEIWWSGVGYVPAREGPAEGLPDPLPGPKPFRAERAWNYPVWIDIHVPENARPGVYRGQVVLRWEKGRAAVPIELRVWPFSIPKRQSVGFVTHLYGPWGWREDIKKWFGDMGYWDFVRKWRPQIFRMLARYRMSPLTLVSMEMRWDEEAGRVEITNAEEYLRLVRYYLSLGCNMYGAGVPYFFNRGQFLGAKKGTEEYLRRITAAYRAAAEFIREHELPTHWHVYCADEVVVHKHTRPIDFELLNRVYDAIAEADRAYRIFATEVPSPLLRTRCQIVWCMNASSFDEDVLRWEKAKGREVWWYNGYRSPRIRADIPGPGMAHRATFWIMHKYGIDGYFIWTVNRWTTNPWKEPNRGRSRAGGHFWLYPNPDGTVAPSLRLVMFRDGAEDYEYLAALERLARELERRGQRAAAERCRRALERAEGIVLAVDNAVCISYEHLRRARELVARTIARYGGI